MSANVKAIRSLAQEAAVDTDLFRDLVKEPVKTVKNRHRTSSDEEAKDIANKALELIATVPDKDIIYFFKQMISNATDAYKKTVFLNEVVFWAGISLLAVTFGFEIAGRVMGNDTWQKVATTGIVGAIGIGTLISSFIMRPLTSIQNSVGHLAQIEVGFLSFIDRRSEIAAIAPQNIDDAKQISDELSKAASETMELIQKYCEEPAPTLAASPNPATPAGAAPQPPAKP